MGRPIGPSGRWPIGLLRPGMRHRLGQAGVQGRGQVEGNWNQCRGVASHVPVRRLRETREPPQRGPGRHKTPGKYFPGP